MLDVIIDALIDSVKLLPFLFITYLIMELLQILKSRVKLYKEFEIKEIEKIE